MAKVIHIDRTTRLTRRIDGAVFVDRRTAYINGTRKHALPFISQWLDGASLSTLAASAGIELEQAELLIRWWQREQFRKHNAKVARLRAQVELLNEEVK